MEDLEWDFNAGERDTCSVCGKFKAGVSMSLGYTDGDFVCEDCIDEYMRKVRTKLHDMVGQNGELFSKLDKLQGNINHIRDMAEADYVHSDDLFEKIGEIYSTVFPNGITSGSPEVVGEYDGKEVKVGGSGIGRIRSSWSQTARYGSIEEQVKIATKLWRSIYPLLSNYQDRTEKFKRMFRAFEEAIEDSSLKPFESDNRIRCIKKFDVTLRWNGQVDDKLVVKKSGSSYGQADIALTVDEFTSIPLGTPKENAMEWVELVPYMEEAFEKAREKNEKKKEQQNEIIREVEDAVSTWYTANSISI